ncbi:MAG: PhoH family protein [Candidatus Omnitrophica bacterium]|nr:PhoH family protein [Candidatus Omnitrophota bacterium]
MEKIFVLDTNVLLHNPDALFSFKDNIVVLPIEVIEELDEFKKDTDEKGRNARLAIRALDHLRGKGKLGHGVKLDEGGVLVIPANIDFDKAGKLGLWPNTKDNRILMTAYILQQEGKDIIFVSKDINSRVKADAIGLTAMDFEKQKVDMNSLYTGWREISVESEKIDEFYGGKIVNAGKNNFFPNEFILLKSATVSKKTALTRYKKEMNTLMPLIYSQISLGGVKPRNKEQAMAQELLLNNDVNLVTLVGRAGTGKTLLALAAGLKKVVDDKTYSRLLISRPVIPLGRDIGYLPGTKEEKLENWMEPIFDNLEFILTGANVKKVPRRGGEKSLNSLVENGVIQLEALTYMRGRSIPHQFIIIDEAQNMTPHEIKTVISRAGEGTKVVLTGDPYQIDNPYLDSNSNGLTYCVDRMKGQAMFGHMTLTKNERSTLASLAADIL